MIIVLKPDSTDEDVERISGRIREWGLTPFVSKGTERTIIGAIGDERILNEVPLESIHGVESVLPILKPYKLVSRGFRPEGSTIDVDGVVVGGKRLQVMAGPCSVEKLDTLIETARAVKAAGASFLRGGAFKPRNSPYSFQGLGEEGLRFLDEARRETGLKIVTELMDPRHSDLVGSHADIVQIGARNMQNFDLLKEVGRLGKPVLLKRGLSGTVTEWLMAAEYIASQGNLSIMLCERGIRTFETETRNTLDLSAVPVVKSLSHLPVVVDPSHGVGKWAFVAPMSLAAVAAGADGLIIEVHPRPEEALSDGPQSLKPDRFATLMRELRKIAAAVGREL